MFHSLARKSVYLFALCGALMATTTVQDAAALNAKDFAGTYNAIVPQLGGVFYRGGADGYTAVVTVTKAGKLSGTWATSSDGLTDTGSVKLTGSISKVTKAKGSSKASFSFKLSDGAKATGTLQAFTGGSGGIVGKLSKGGAKVSIAGSKMP